MKFLILFSLVCFTNANAEVLSGKYELQNSKIHYVVSYLIKRADGASTQAKGKGECTTDGCNFLVAAPVKSFESKDSNRDLNMLKTLKADKNPLVVAKIKTKNEIVNADLKADVEIEIAGVKKSYPVVFKTRPIENGFHATGDFVLLLDSHQIEKPSLLGVDIKNEVPISIEADWKK